MKAQLKRALTALNIPFTDGEGLKIFDAGAKRWPSDDLPLANIDWPYSPMYNETLGLHPKLKALLTEHKAWGEFDLDAVCIFFH